MRGLQRRVRGRTRLALLTAVLVVVFVVAGAGAALASVWTDISDAEWQSTYGITAAQAQSVASGYADGSFHPKEAVKRGQFAKMVVDGFDIAYYTPGTATFPDVPKSHTFFKYVEGGVKAGLISGYNDGTFKPNNTISRQQANSILGKYLSQRELSEKGVITGKNGQTYTSLKAWYDEEGALVLAYFNDAVNVAAVHAPGTAYLVYRQVVKGSNGYLNPGSTLTRAQAVALIVRVRSVTFEAPSYTAEMPLSLVDPAPSANNTIAITGTGGTRTVTVNVANGTTSVLLTGLKTTTQDVTVGGANASSVTTAGTTTMPSFQVNTSAVATGGARVFTLTLSETGKQSVVYTVTVNVAAGLNLSLVTPAPSTTSSITTTGSGTNWTVNIKVPNGTKSVVLSGSLTTSQTVTVSGTNASSVVTSGTYTAPFFTIDTEAISANGGQRIFTLTLRESGKAPIVYEVIVTVGPDFNLALSSPSPTANNGDNTLTLTGNGLAWNADVKVVYGTTAVVLTGTKTAAQGVAITGTGAALVTAGGSSTSPTYTINTASISAGSTEPVVFTLTVSEDGKSDIVFTVRVYVLPLTSNVVFALTSPTGEGNTIETTGTGLARTVNATVANQTSSVVLTGTKTAAQTVTIGGTDAAFVSAGGTSTLATYTINTDSIKNGGTRSFTLTVRETNKSTVVYTVTVTVKSLTTPMTLALTAPAPSANNSIATSGSGAALSVTVKAAHNTASVLLTGAKTAAQIVTIGGTHGALVSAGGTSTAPTYSINTSSIATGGSINFTLTLGEADKGSIVYTVTVTVGGPYTSDMLLSLITPSPGTGNELTPPPETTGETRTVTVNVVNGVTSVVLAGNKLASQTVTVGGTNASNVTAGGTPTAPTFTVNTSSVASGGSKVFTLTVSEPGKSNLVYTVTIVVGGLTKPLENFRLTSPDDSLPGNGFEITGSGAARAVKVDVANGTETVELKATKTEEQTVVIGGPNAADVTSSGTPTDPAYSVVVPNAIAQNGGTMTFTLTVNEPGLGSIVYTVTLEVARPYAEFTSLKVTKTIPDNGLLDSIPEGSGPARTVEVAVAYGTTQVVLTGELPPPDRKVVVGGANKANVKTSTGDGNPTYTVDTSAVQSGGTRVFTLEVSQEGYSSVTYTVTISVGGYTQPLTNLALLQPEPDASNTINVAGSGSTRTVTVNVQAETDEVKLTATKQSAQTLEESSDGVTVSDGDNPTITFDTREKAGGGDLEFEMELKETGKGSISYTVRVTVAKPYTADLAGMTLTSPAGSGNELSSPSKTSAGTRAVPIKVINGTGTVIFTATKGTNQSISENSPLLAVTNASTGSTNSTFTVDTSSISSGGLLSFNFEVQQADSSSLTYTVTVEVAGPTSELSNLELSIPEDDDLDNDVTESGTGSQRTVLVRVKNGTERVSLTAKKASAQTVVVSGPNAGDVGVTDAETDLTLTVNTSSICETGGNRRFAVTVSEPGKADRVYDFTVMVAMDDMTLSLTSPTPGLMNTITAPPGTVTAANQRMIEVQVVNGTTSVLLTGSKRAVQSVQKDGPDSALVTITDGLTASPKFTVNTSDLASAGGKVQFTITLSESGKNNIVYTVEVTVLPRTAAFTSLALASPADSEPGNDISWSGSGGTRTVAVTVVNGTGSVTLVATKDSNQTVAKDGEAAPDVELSGDTTDSTSTTIKINTDSIKAGGGSKKFELTLRQDGYGSIVYDVTVTVAAP